MRLVAPVFVVRIVFLLLVVEFVLVVAFSVWMVLSSPRPLCSSCVAIHGSSFLEELYVLRWWLVFPACSTSFSVLAVYV
jgi:hypothetical protein